MRGLLVCAGLALVACRSHGPEIPDAWDLNGQTAGFHEGPIVAVGHAGPRPFAEGLLEAIDGRAAATPIDGDEALHGAFEAAGYGSDPSLLLNGAVRRGATQAHLVGGERPDEWVVLHARDAESAGALVEVARALAEQHRGGMQPLRRSVVFLHGDLAQAWLPGEPTVVAVLEAGNLAVPGGFEEAVCTLERAPDPGALSPLPPDPVDAVVRDAGAIREFEVSAPSGVSLVARMALVDVGLITRPWRSAEVPSMDAAQFEIFSGKLVDAEGEIVLPGTREASMPRMIAQERTLAPTAHITRRAHVAVDTAPDPDEVRRATAAWGAAALALADAKPADLNRYMDSLLLERRLRLNMVETEGADPTLATEWDQWFSGARQWLRALCLGLDLP